MRRYACALLALVCAVTVSCGNKSAVGEKSNGDIEHFTEDLSENTAVSDGRNTDDIADISDDDTADNVISGITESEDEISLSFDDTDICPVMMFMVDGQLYYDTGENSRLTPRCGTLDGKFELLCGEYELPKTDGCANFGRYDEDFSGWQNASDDTKEVLLEDGWRIFKKAEIYKGDISDFKGCMRICGDKEYIIITVNHVSAPKDRAPVYIKPYGEHRDIVIPIKYGEVYDWGITLEAKNVTPTSMTLVISQSGGNLKGEINTGTPYELSVWNGSFWERQPYREGVGDVAWNMPAFNIPTGSEREFEINWEWLYGALPAGKYRISKELMDFKATADYDEHTYYLEFEIPEIMICEDFEAVDEVSDENGEICGYPRYEDMKE